MKMMCVPAGEFEVGSRLSPEEVVRRYGGREALYAQEHPLHRVRISERFYMAACPVTVEQFRRFVTQSGYVTQAEKGGQDCEQGRKGGYHICADGKMGWRKAITWRRPGFEQTDEHPVVLVSWHDAKAFCQWLSKKEGRTYRLPTEAEFEYACRAGTETAYWWGDALRRGSPANMADEAHRARADGYQVMPGDDGWNFTSPAGHYMANGFGLRDMLGNVWEWCEDWKSERYHTGLQIDPKGPASGTRKVCRGGSWLDTADYCRSASRARAAAGNRATDIGFRVVCEGMQESTKMP
jgi:formylglycine-generating enzyme required for sulfatase activity